MAGYDTTNPGDSSPVSAFPANERALRTFLKNIMGVNHVTAEGADQGIHTEVTLAALPEHPSPIEGKGQLYMVETEEGTDLFYMNGAGDTIRFTKGNSIDVELPDAELVVKELTTETITTNTLTTETLIVGDINVASLFADDMETAAMFAGYYMGKVVELEIVGGELAIDWQAGQYFVYDNTQTHVVTFVNLPAIGSGVGQTICLNISNAGAFGISLDAETGYQVQVRQASKGEALVGRTRVIAMVDQDGIVDVVTLMDFVPNT